MALGLLQGALALCLASARAGEAGQAIHRCAGANGEIVFSGLPCTTSAVTDSAMPAPGTTGTPLRIDACTASRHALRDNVAAAVARHDTNALAGMLRWHGVDGASVDNRLHALRELVKRPLIAIDAQEGYLDETGDPTLLDGDSLRVRTGSDASGGPQERAFGVTVDADGCYWLLWQESRELR